MQQHQQPCTGSSLTSDWCDRAARQQQPSKGGSLASSWCVLPAVRQRLCLGGALASGRPDAVACGGSCRKPRRLLGKVPAAAAPPYRLRRVRPPIDSCCRGRGRRGAELALPRRLVGPAFENWLTADRPLTKLRGPSPQELSLLRRPAGSPPSRLELGGRAGQGCRTVRGPGSCISRRCNLLPCVEVLAAAEGLWQAVAAPKGLAALSAAQPLPAATAPAASGGGCGSCGRTVPFAAAAAARRGEGVTQVRPLAGGRGAAALGARARPPRAALGGARAPPARGRPPPPPVLPQLCGTGAFGLVASTVCGGRPPWALLPPAPVALTATRAPGLAPPRCGAGELRRSLP